MRSFLILGTLVCAAQQSLGQCENSWALESAQTNLGVVAGHCTAFDEVRGVHVLLRGDQVWEHAGPEDQWRLVAEGGIPPRGAAGMCWDRIRHRIVVYGGEGGGGKYNDIWAWDGQSWEQWTDGTGGPSGRSYVAIAHDAQRDRFVMFGGYDSSLQGDTWEWSHQLGWQQVSTGGPEGLYAHRMVYDDERGVCVLHGGYYFFNRNETWTWNGIAWTLASSGNGPARYVFSMAWDSLRNQVVCFSGTQCCPESESQEEWRWDGGSWSRCSDVLEVPGRGYTDWSYDSWHDELRIVGGFGMPQGQSERVALSDAWVHALGGTLNDCDGDGIPDHVEIANNLACDTNLDGLPDQCVCPQELDCDGSVGMKDLMLLLEQWGTVNANIDFDEDGVVDFHDLLWLLRAFGPC